MIFRSFKRDGGLVLCLCKVLMLFSRRSSLSHFSRWSPVWSRKRYVACGAPLFCDWADMSFLSVLYLIFYHIFLVLFAWSYWQCIVTNGGKIPPKVSNVAGLTFLDHKCHVHQFFLSSAQVTDLELARSAKDFDGMKRLLEKYAQDLPVQTRGYNGG